jgi:hypothetical protein
MLYYFDFLMVFCGPKREEISRGYNINVQGTILSILSVCCREPTLRSICLLVKHCTCICRVNMAGHGVILLQPDKLYTIPARYTSNVIMFRECN